MKKIITLAVAAMLVTGAAFAGEGKKCGAHKGCCKKGAKEVAKKADKPAEETKSTEEAKKG